MHPRCWRWWTSGEAQREGIGPSLSSFHIIYHHWPVTFHSGHNNLTFHLKNRQNHFRARWSLPQITVWSQALSQIPSLGLNQRQAHAATKASLMVFSSQQDIPQDTVQLWFFPGSSSTHDAKTVFVFSSKTLGNHKPALVNRLLKIGWERRIAGVRSNHYQGWMYLFIVFHVWLGTQSLHNDYH